MRALHTTEYIPRPMPRCHAYPCALAQSPNFRRRIILFVFFCEPVLASDCFDGLFNIFQHLPTTEYCAGKITSERVVPQAHRRTGGYWHPRTPFHTKRCRLGKVHVLLDAYGVQSGCNYVLTYFVLHTSAVALKDQQVVEVNISRGHQSCTSASSTILCKLDIQTPGFGAIAFLSRMFSGRLPGWDEEA